MAALIFSYWDSVSTRVVALSGYSANAMNSINETSICVNNKEDNQLDATVTVN
jgi:hypothetical protein